jgi:hypothetical protein
MMRGGVGEELIGQLRFRYSLLICVLKEKGVPARPIESGYA